MIKYVLCLHQGFRSIKIRNNIFNFSGDEFTIFLLYLNKLINFHLKN